MAELAPKPDAINKPSIRLRPLLAIVLFVMNDSRVSVSFGVRLAAEGTGLERRRREPGHVLRMPGETMEHPSASLHPGPQWVGALAYIREKLRSANGRCDDTRISSVRQRGEVSHGLRHAALRAVYANAQTRCAVGLKSQV